MNRIWMTLALAWVLAAIAGCDLWTNPDPNVGYTLASPYRSDVKTVYVPIWRRGKQVYRRDIEIRLSEAIAKRIETDTPYKIADRGVADTELSGVLRSVRQRVLSYDPRSGLARQIELELVVDFTWTDLRPTGGVIREEEGFVVGTTYIPPAPFSEDFFQGSEDAINKLAERIVEQLAAEW